MKRSEMLELLTKRINELDWNPYDTALGVLDIIEKHMDPKYAGKHQGSFNITIGTPCRWDKEDD